MSSAEFSLDAFLSDSPVDSNTSGGSFATIPAGTYGPGKEPGYEGEIDYRIRQLSYSSLLTLHSCPRKYQLQKLRSVHRTEEPLKSTITFSFGHVVGEGIALALAGTPLPQIYWKMFLSWHTPSIFDADDKAKKSLWTAFQAIERFFLIRDSILKDYELVWYNGKPATELSFSILLPDGFRLRGFVDAVLRHRSTGEILVLECKTTGSATINPASYKNSAQAIGYSVVLDHLYPDLSSYRVLYLVYGTKDGEYIPLPFTKTFLQRAIWIRELLLDVELIKMYSAADLFPMHGESCYNFFRECEYLQSCTLSTDALARPFSPEQIDTTEYQVVVTLADLLHAQITKASALPAPAAPAAMNPDEFSSLDSLL
jgi:hypothetical protein